MFNYGFFIYDFRFSLVIFLLNCSVLFRKEKQKLFPAAGSMVISRSFRKIFVCMRRTGITLAARITFAEWLNLRSTF